MTRARMESATAKPYAQPAIAGQNSYRLVRCGGRLVCHRAFVSVQRGGRNFSAATRLRGRDRSSCDGVRRPISVAQSCWPRPRPPCCGRRVRRAPVPIAGCDVLNFLDRFGTYGTLALLSVIRPEHVDHWIKARASEDGFSVRPGPHGYCILFRDRGAKAACSTDGRVPDLTNRTDQHCASCCNFLVTCRSKEYWEARAEVHERTLRSSKIKVVRAVAKLGFKAARRMLSSIRVSSNERR